MSESRCGRGLGPTRLSLEGWGAVWNDTPSRLLPPSFWYPQGASLTGTAKLEPLSTTTFPPVPSKVLVRQCPSLRGSTTPVSQTVMGTPEGRPSSLSRPTLTVTHYPTPPSPFRRDSSVDSLWVSYVSLTGRVPTSLSPERFYSLRPTRTVVYYSVENDSRRTQGL